jgi:hypothetical protein
MVLSCSVFDPYRGTRVPGYAVTPLPSLPPSPPSIPSLPAPSSLTRSLHPPTHPTHPLTQAVCLKRCGLNPRSARFVARTLRANNERRDQLIWRGELRSEVVSKLAVRLQGLLVLDLSENELADSGVAEVLDALENDRWMVAVNLARNGCTVNLETPATVDKCFEINRELSE